MVKERIERDEPMNFEELGVNPTIVLWRKCNQQTRLINQLFYKIDDLQETVSNMNAKLNKL